MYSTKPLKSMFLSQKFTNMLVNTLEKIKYVRNIIITSNIIYNNSEE